MTKRGFSLGLWPGVNSSSIVSSGGGGGEDYTAEDAAADVDAAAYMNFLSGHYKLAGSVVMPAAFIDQPELITSNGLVIPESGNVVVILGDFLTKWLTANYTGMIEWDHLDSTATIFPLVLANVDSNDDFLEIKRQNTLGNRFMTVDDFSGPNFRSATDATAAVLDGIHRIAFNRTNTTLEFSIDGRATVASLGDLLDFSIIPTSACFGGVFGGTTNSETRIRKCKIFNTLQTSGDLPSISSIP